MVWLPLVGIDELLPKIREIAQSLLVSDSTGHDWQHVERVYNLCIRLGEAEGAKLDVLGVAAILHDVGLKDEFETGRDHANAGAESARSLLLELGVRSEFAESVCYAIGMHRFGGGVAAETLEARVLQDADRLDALGAIGIARAFAYGGARGAPIYDPGEVPEAYDPFKIRSTITHFYEKLLKVKDSMNTESARKIAEGRHAFMLEFLERFRSEMAGER